MISFTVDFENYLINEKKSSKNTVESYMRDISKFVSYCELNHIKNVTAVNDDAIKKYEQFMLFNGQSESSISRSFASLRCYFHFLKRQKFIDNLPEITVSKRTAVKKLPEILTNKEILTLLQQPDASDYKGCRDKAMLELLYATGIKVTELIELNVDDINLQIGILHMHSSKGERIIPIYPDAVKSLKNYLINVRSVVVENEDEQRLFTNMNGQPMTRQGFWKIIKQYASSAKIKKDITPHTIRHSFAAHLLENGAQLSDIKEMLGHADISSTQIYAQLMKNKYASSYSRFHPLAK
ncbi:MAG: tyrosine recombinase [Clostridia bacterium]|nr:tyrosine recombinase [Clostridia bacterium]